MNSKQRITIKLALAALLWGGVAFGASSEAQSVKSVPITIPAGELKEALKALVRMTGVQLLYDQETVKGVRTQGVKGASSAREAVEELLHGTALVTTLDESGAMLIAQQVTQGSSDVRSSLRLGQAEEPSEEHPEQTMETADRRISQARRRPQGYGARETPGTAEVVVVDSRLRGSRGRDFAQPVKVITREQIARSGAGNIAQVLNSLPEVSIGATGTVAQDDFGATTVQLRGQGTALVLINGRRVVTSAYQARSDYFDLSTIPLSMVERIEVLTAGSSAVYGGDGLSGVVNVVLKERATGLEGNLRHGVADGYDETQFGMSWGYARNEHSVMLTGTFARNSELQGAERAITADQDHRRFGAADNRSTASNPGNIYSLTGGNLPGLDAPYAAVPQGSTGAGLTPADFAQTAGTLNRSSTLAASSLLSPQERLGLSLHGRYQLMPAVELFTEVLYSQTELDQYSIDLLTLTGGEFGSWVVDASHPFNPFGVDVGVDYLFETDRFRQRLSQEYLRPLVGVRAEAGNWDMELAAWVSRDQQHQDRTGTVNFLATSQALAATDPTQALNVFQDGAGGSSALIDSLLSPIPRRGYFSELQAANAWLRGAPLRLPSGEVQLALGMEYARSTLRYEPTIASNEDRGSKAAFAETRIPLWPQEAVVVSLAARYDDYSDFGSRASPGFGVEIRPFDSLLLRGSYNESFKPPILYQLYFPQFIFPTFVTDPVLGQSYLTSQRFGGNPALQPEFGLSRTLGLVFEPALMPDFRIVLTWWNIGSNNSTTGLSPQLLVNNESLFATRVTRDPQTNRISLVDNTFINFGSVDEDGYDFDMQWRKRTSAGEFTPQLSASYTDSYRVQLVPGGSVADRVGQAGYPPRWKATGSLRWSQRRLETTVSGRYIGTYRDYAPLLNGTYRTLGGMLYVDANARYEFAGRAGWLSDMASAYLSLGAVNLLDRGAQFANNRPFGFDPGQYDLRGRLWYAEIGVSF